MRWWAWLYIWADWTWLPCAASLRPGARSAEDLTGLGVWTSVGGDSRPILREPVLREPVLSELVLYRCGLPACSPSAFFQLGSANQPGIGRAPGLLLGERPRGERPQVEGPPPPSPARFAHPRFSSTTRMPYRGRRVIEAMGTTGCCGTILKRNCCAIVASTSVVSIRAKAFPMHCRGPPPKGK